MRIRVKSSDGKRVNLAFPTSFFYWRPTAFIAYKIVQNAVEDHADMEISKQDVYRFMDALKRMKKKYGKLDLIDVLSKDGDVVKIIL